jgi:hypothetical protein
VVGVDEVEGAGVELEAARRTTQGDPELLVELVEGEKIGAGVEADLVEPAGPPETPAVLGSRVRWVWHEFDPRWSNGKNSKSLQTYY